MKFDDANDDLNSLIKRIIEHRLANPKIYPTAETFRFDQREIAHEIAVQICADKPQICEDSAFPGRAYPYIPPEPPPAPAEVYRQQGLECPRCHSQDFELQYCATCGGKRVTGKKCLKCGWVV